MRISGAAIAGIVAVVLIALCLWWALSLRQTSPLPQAQRTPPTDTSYPAPSAIAVHYAKVNGADVYSGMLPVRPCDTMASGLSTTGNNPPHLTLTFRVLDGDGTCVGNTESASSLQPFSFSYFSRFSTTTPILDAILINGVSTPFTLLKG